MILQTGCFGQLKGQIRPPGDKSISHRALMLGALAKGDTTIRGLLNSEDVSHTADCLQQMGVSIHKSATTVTITGRGEEGLEAPQQIMDAGNSGTTMRLLMGIIAGHSFQASLSGDVSLQKRPMDRVAAPLQIMGAKVEGKGERYFPPISIRGGQLKAIEYETPIASAQVKSAILLAGLQAKGRTCVKEPGLSRDHTERMLEMFGGELEYGPGFAGIEGGRTLQALEISIPGDFSAAAFFIVGAALVNGSEVEVEQVGLNPTRTGLLEVLDEMGADVEVRLIEPEGTTKSEPAGKIIVRGRERLRGCKIDAGLIPRLIDELPVICVAAACADGQTEIRGAAELRVKESDRISSMAAVLKELGVDGEELADGMIIQGKKALKQAKIDSRGDHRVAMAAAIAGLRSDGVEIAGAECIATSYPNFAKDLRRLGASVAEVE